MKNIKYITFSLMVLVSQVGYAGFGGNPAGGLSLVALMAAIQRALFGSAPAATNQNQGAAAAAAADDANQDPRLRAARQRQAEVSRAAMERDAATRAQIEAQQQEDTERQRRERLALLEALEQTRLAAEAERQRQAEETQRNDRETLEASEQVARNQIETDSLAGFNGRQEFFQRGLGEAQINQLIQSETNARTELVQQEDLGALILRRSTEQLRAAVAASTQIQQVLSEAGRQTTPVRAGAPVYLHNLYYARTRLLGETVINLPVLQELNAWIARAEDSRTRDTFDALMHDHRYQLPHQSFDQARDRNQLDMNTIMQYIAQVKWLASKGFTK